MNAKNIVRVMTDADLAIVLAWRNHSSVRQQMFHSAEISEAEHEKWFAACTMNDKRHLLVYEERGKPMGFVQFTELNAGKVAEWGFYKSPTAPAGVGHRLGSAALDYAADSLALVKICGNVFENNKGSIRFHEKLGFELEGTLRMQHYDGENYLDVWCFGYIFNVQGIIGK